MARKARVTKSGGTTIVQMPSAAPVVRRRRSGGGGRRRTRKSSRRRSSGGGGGRNLTHELVGYGVGGFAVGFLEKSFPGLPSLPVVGRKGAIAIAAYFLRGKHPIITDIGRAAAAISGYELGSVGRISGIDGDGDGIAAQI